MDVVIAGHSHSRLDLRVPNADGSGDKLVVEALSYGVAYDLVDLDRRPAHAATWWRRRARIPDTRTARRRPRRRRSPGWWTRYRGRVAPLAERVVGRAETELTRSDGSLGALVARAERAFAGTDAAVVPPRRAPRRHRRRADHLRGGRAGARVRPPGHAARADRAASCARSRGGGLRGGAGHELDPDVTYSVAASEQIAPGGGRWAPRSRRSLGISTAERGCGAPGG